MTKLPKVQVFQDKNYLLTATNLQSQLQQPASQITYWRSKLILTQDTREITKSVLDISLLSDTSSSLGHLPKNWALVSRWLKLFSSSGKSIETFNPKRTKGVSGSQKPVLSSLGCTTDLSRCQNNTQVVKQQLAKLHAPPEILQTYRLTSKRLHQNAESPNTIEKMQSHRCRIGIVHWDNPKPVNRKVTCAECR